jgi:phosphoenolpyruvate carboxykinase (GTP)
MYSQMADAPEGVPISAILFGGRRRELAPLVYEARNWAHGVFVGASMASETTAAAEGQVGIARRDPMAMKPFCGYNFGDYWNHWLSFEHRASRLPRVFHVNWFRQDRGGKYLWPGYSENLRVLDWIIKRCENSVGAVETPIGLLPNESDIDVGDLEVDGAALKALLSVNSSAWQDELDAVDEYLKTFGHRIPPRLNEELAEIRRRLTDYSSQA